MAKCEDYPCCGHTDGLGCEYRPDMVFIYAHALCDHENEVCDLLHDEWHGEVDPEDCEHGDATDYNGWVCDGCGEPLVKVTDVSPKVYRSKVIPGLLVEIPVLGWHFEVAS